ASLAANPQMPSQLDECGAAITTIFGWSGNSPTTRHPPSRSTDRPIQRARGLGATRGALAGSGGTTSLLVLIDLPRRGPAPASVPVAPAACLLDRTTLALVDQAPLARGARGAGGDARLGRAQAGVDERLQALACVLAVALLGAEALRLDHQHAGVGHAPVAPRQQSRAHRLGQRGRAGHIEAQF